jgi:hypothetical protein
MTGYRDGPDSGDDLTGAPVRQNLKATRAYGCLLASLLGGAMSFVVFLGNIMGDCLPGPGCHDNDGVHIMKDLAVALPIAAVLGVGMWLFAAVVRAALQPIFGERLVILVLVALTLALAWFGFNPAMETFFQWTAPGNS